MPTQQPDAFGFAAYLSSFAAQKPMLERWASSHTPVFTSLHISEEFSPAYQEDAQAMCGWMKAAGFHIVADVSRKTMAAFGTEDMTGLAQKLGLYALRLDYGFSEEEMLALARHIPIVLNASTVDAPMAERLVAGGGQVAAMHNYYPRPETGLDPAFMAESTTALQKAGLRVLAFIPGTAEKRGPLFAGLPTVEEHRGWPPLVSYAEMRRRYGVDGTYFADLTLQDEQAAMMRRFETEDVLPVPAALSGEARALYGRVFTCRPDAPAALVRFAESREYSCFGADVPPQNCVQRLRGSITLDNRQYGRYSGEVQMPRCDLPADERVNVVGQVPAEYLPLLDCITRGSRFCLVEM